MSKLKSVFEFIMALLGFLLDFGRKKEKKE
ncbi:hypothetical protein GGQ57_002875 [Parabacteroides faecis]|jgi:hypothetical protein|uniref:Uncharacterized protein n=1 Tax=Parabacteroides faecis TaxID=1217282 RepID=A0ABR6KN72_9BACT|nr:hypothetical protein [Parabacteroides faecis]